MRGQRSRLGEQLPPPTSATEGKPRSYSLPDVQTGVDIVVRRSLGKLSLIILPTVVLFAGFALAYVTREQPRRVAATAPKPPSTSAAAVTAMPPITSVPVSSSTATSVPVIASTTTVPPPTSSTSLVTVTTSTAKQAAPQVLSALADIGAAVVQVRRVALDGSICGATTGVYLAKDGLVLTARSAPSTAQGCANADIVVAQVQPATGKLTPQFRGHVAVENARLGVMIVQLDRDAQGRRTSPELPGVAMPSKRLVGTRPQPVRILFHASNDSADLTIVSSVASATGGVGQLRLEPAVGKSAVGGVVVDEEGQLLGLIGQTSVGQGQPTFVGLVAMGELLQRVGLDLVAIP